MILLNQIDEINKNEILCLLKDKSLDFKLFSNVDCYELYYQTFKDLKKICSSK
jgi:hypothetical protein